MKRIRRARCFDIEQFVNWDGSDLGYEFGWYMSGDGASLSVKMTRLKVTCLIVSTFPHSLDLCDKCFATPVLELHQSQENSWSVDGMLLCTSYSYCVSSHLHYLHFQLIILQLPDD